MATEVIWHVFGEDYTKIPPIVQWYEGEKLNCADGRAFWTVYEAREFYQSKTCVRGLYAKAMHLAIVAKQPNQALSDTALAHELCHAYFRDTAAHEVCKDDGSPDDPVTRANEQLRKMGL